MGTVPAMPRAPKTRTERANDVQRAADRLADAVRDAILAEHAHGPSDPRTIAAWETVEQYGATVHRQSRPLAGKSKGG